MIHTSSCTWSETLSLIHTFAVVLQVINNLWKPVDDTMFSMHLVCAYFCGNAILYMHFPLAFGLEVTCVVIIQEKLEVSETQCRQSVSGLREQLQESSRKLEAEQQRHHTHQVGPSNGIRIIRSTLQSLWTYLIFLGERIRFQASRTMAKRITKGV